MKIRKCPKCKSTNIAMSHSFTSDMYECGDCKYSGAFVIEEEEK